MSKKNDKVSPEIKKIAEAIKNLYIDKKLEPDKTQAERDIFVSRQLAQIKIILGILTLMTILGALI